MKRLTVLLMAIASLAIAFNSCGKYEEGPDFSLRTKTARITGTWEIEKMTFKTLENDELIQEEEYSPEADEQITYTLERGGTGEVVYSEIFDGVTFTESMDLEWRFSDDKTELEVREKYDGTWSAWESTTIIRLTNSEMWLQEIETYGDIKYVSELRFSKI